MTPDTEERTHLQNVLAALRAALERIETRLDDYARDIQRQKDYLWEHRAEMDHVEKIGTRQSIEQALDAGEALLARRKRLHKLLAVPYFGRVDFQRAGEDKPMDVYVGVHGFEDEASRKTLIYDWRAPIAGLFYDYELGPARYVSPAGAVSGEITLKRQFRIRDGVMEFMLDSALPILDEVLQKTLSQATNARMKDIVATIQRDQNAIIRNEAADTLIIQGVAGSGKTSIALHRIAFLLYRFKDSLSSKDILIVSPNRVFADYIANVLPELGEERVAETQMEALADELLDYKYKFQTFFEQAALLVEGGDEGLAARLRFKSSLDLIKRLDEYAEHVEAKRFSPTDLWLGRRLVPAWYLAETWAKHRTQPAKVRLERLAAAVEQNIGIHYHHDLTPEERRTLKEALRGMYRSATLRETYKQFFDWLGCPDLFRPAKGGRLEYADVFPLIHLKSRLEGLPRHHRQVKHLVVDEMQDYTPVQYAVLARLFPCKKTILGDANQSVNPITGSTAETIRAALGQGECVRLNKSYRSTWEIAQFAQRIIPNPDFVALERHGEEPRIIACKNQRAQIDLICAEIAAFRASGYTALGIVCKTQKQAERLYKALDGEAQGLNLLDAHSDVFTAGVLVCCAHLAKGLEFDQVIVPQADAENYRSDIDRQLLYIACTRAMHRLLVSHVGGPTGYLAPRGRTWPPPGDESGHVRPSPYCPLPVGEGSSESRLRRLSCSGSSA